MLKKKELLRDFFRLWIGCRLVLAAILITIEAAGISLLNIPLGKHFIEKGVIVYLFISTIPPLLFKGRVGGFILATDTLTAIGAVFLSPSPIMPFLAGPEKRLFQRSLDL